MREAAAACCWDPGPGRASTRGGGAGRGGEAMRPGRAALFPFGYLLCLPRTCCKAILFVRVVVRHAELSYGHQSSTCVCLPSVWTNNKLDKQGFGC